MSEYDEVIGVADSRGKLVKSLESSISFFKYLQKIVNSTPDLERRFHDSIHSIDESIKIVKKMDKESFTKLVDEMYEKNHKSNFS